MPTGVTWVAEVAGLPFTVARVFTASRFAAVGLVTVHNEHVPADVVTVLAMARAPAGMGLATVTVNDTVAEEPAATATASVQEMPAAEPVGQDQPSLAAPVKVVLAGTVSVNMAVPALVPPLVTVTW
jgi:hypothetical protein